MKTDEAMAKIREAQALIAKAEELIHEVRPPMAREFWFVIFRTDVERAAKAAKDHVDLQELIDSSDAD